MKLLIVLARIWPEWTRRSPRTRVRHGMARDGEILALTSLEILYRVRNFSPRLMDSVTSQHVTHQ
jgi:hypothetical protein